MVNVISKQLKWVIKDIKLPTFIITCSESCNLVGCI